MIDKQGHNLLTTTKEEKDPRWIEHFQEVLNRPSPIEIADTPRDEEDLDIDPPREGEIVAAIYVLKMKNCLV